MSEPKTITINDVKYIREDATKVSDTPIKIVVLDRGWVYVGRPIQMDGYLQISQARCIRQWGTTQGLAELVNGPTKSTKLDASAMVRVPDRAIIQQIDVDSSSWAKHI